jgi:hypothetical protein
MTDPLTQTVVAIMGKYVVDAGVKLAKEAGSAAAAKAADLAQVALGHLRREPAGQVIADGFEAKPDVYAKPLEDQLATAVQADPAFKEQLAALLADYEAEQASYQASLSGSGAIAQGDQATALGERSSYVGGSAGMIITGDHNVIQVGPPGPTPSGEPARLEWTDPASGQTQEIDVDLVALRDRLVEHFSLGELNDLLFTLGVDDEDIPGRTRSDKARQLIGYFDRRGRLPDLLAACRAARPNVEWLAG